MSQLQLEYKRGEVLATKYEIVDVLGRSPLGMSYRVKHLQSGSYVRLLLLDPGIAGKEQKDAIIEAVRVARSLSHRGLLKMGELGQHAGVAYVTMEDFEAPTLREVINQKAGQNQPFELREAAQITIKVLDALHYLHQQGHVFRALRPEQVLVNLRRTGPGGKNLVADVRVVGAGLWDLVPTGTLAEDEFTRGEAQYLAPEFKGLEPRPTPRSDVFSAGVMFYEILIGQPPTGTYQLPRARRPDLPAHVDSVAQFSLAVFPDDRYPSANDFGADIQRTFQISEVGETDSATSSVHPAVWVLGGLVVVAAAAALFWSDTDPMLEAMAADQALRREVKEQHPMPTSEQLTTLQASYPNMMLIPGGPYISGKLKQEFHVREPEPNAEVRTIPGFLMDVFEFPNQQRAAPKNKVTYAQAEAACTEQGKRLCSAEEFEKACKGPANFVYGYGDAWDPEFCGEGLDGVHPAGAMSECKSGWGVYDIAGNFREWTSTPRGDGRRLVKGGLPGNTEKGTRCAYASDESALFGDDSMSFRCCLDLPPELGGAAPPPAPAGDGG